MKQRKRWKRTRSSAVAERPHDASCHCIFRKVIQCYSKLHHWEDHFFIPHKHSTA